MWHVPSSSFPGHFPAAMSAALFCCMACCSANLSPTLWVILTYLSAQFSTRSTEGVSFQARHVRCLVGKDTPLALVCCLPMHGVSYLSSDFDLKEFTQLLKHLSTKVLYILRRGFKEVSVFDIGQSPSLFAQQRARLTLGCPSSAFPLLFS